MKNILFIFLCFVSVSLMGQTNAQIEKEAQPNIQLYKMDNTQAQQYVAILVKKSESIVELKKLSSEAKRHAIIKIENEYEKSFIAILNEDQQKIFKTQKIIAENIKNRTAKSF